MKKFHIGFACVMLSVGFISALLCIKYSVFPDEYIYKGKVAFYTEEEYSFFKQLLAQDYVQFSSEDITILSSSPPIIVNFEVTVDSDYSFPFGKKGKDVVSIGLIAIGAVILLGGGTYLIIYNLGENEEGG